MPQMPIQPTDRLSNTDSISKSLQQDQSYGQEKSLGRFKRLRQYQPSQKLVKVWFVWWLLIVFFSAFTLSDGFGIDALAGISNAVEQGMPWIVGLVSIVIILLALLDLCCLISLSQASRFKLVRQYPSNVPLLHQLYISVYLSFNLSHKGSKTQSLLDKLVQLLLTKGAIKSVTLDFYDDYPNHLALIESHNAVDTDAMPIRAFIDIHSQTHNSFADTEHTQPQKHQPASQMQLDMVKMIKIEYPVIAIERGTGYFSAASIRVWSPLGLFKRQFQLTSVEDKNKYLRVLADFSGLLNNQLSAAFETSVDAGMQSILQQGHGSDFLKLREYTPGDAIRQIDWKASSRQRRLMSKSYEDDNDQEVMFLLDCGEQMRHRDIMTSDTTNDVLLSGYQQQTDYQISYFDKVLNAVLLLSYVVNKQGDRVGLMSFAGSELYLPPKKGTSLVRNLLNATADLKPTMLTSDYVSAAQDLVQRLHKRSLIILITNTRTEASEELTQALKLLSQRHQVVFANLSEQVVVDHLHGNIAPENLDDALLYHALNDYQLARQKLHKQLSQQTGALCLQTTANQLPMKLTQAYLSLKKG